MFSVIGCEMVFGILCSIMGLALDGGDYNSQISIKRQYTIIFMLSFPLSLKLFMSICEKQKNNLLSADPKSIKSAHQLVKRFKYLFTMLLSQKRKGQTLTYTSSYDTMLMLGSF